jgi:hypothetical protein
MSLPLLDSSWTRRFPVGGIATNSAYAGGTLDFFEPGQTVRYKVLRLRPSELGSHISHTGDLKGVFNLLGLVYQDVRPQRRRDTQASSARRGNAGPA